MNINKIQIFSAATGPYKKFITPFVQSFNSLFFSNIPKEFILFVDEEVDIPSRPSNIPQITWVNTTHEPWPEVTLMRYKLIKDYLSQNQPEESIIYLWLDIDLECVKKVEYNPLEFQNCEYITVQHPGNYVANMLNSLEGNPLSEAYLDKKTLDGLPYTYAQGCLWGGFGRSFRNMVDSLEASVRIDNDKEITAIWHDESHLNKFIVENIKLNKNNIKTLSSSFAYPQNWDLGIEAIIIHKDKNMDEFPRFQGGSIR